MYYRSRQRSSRLTDYIMPFLIIIAVGVIIVLVFNLIKALFFAEAPGDAFLHLESGSVQVKAFGTEGYLDLTSDALIMQGDEMKTSADTQAIIEFFDGTIMRLDGNTDVVLDQIDNGDDPYINVILVNGKLWFNKLYKSTDSTSVEIAMANIVVKSTAGSIFEVENEFEEIARVISGDEIVIDVLNNDGSKVVESEKVGVNQEMIFTDKVLEKYWQFQSPSVLTGISDEFEDTKWFTWNSAEDKSPTEFSKSAILGGEEYVEVAPEIIQPSGEDDATNDDTMDMEPALDESDTEPAEEEVAQEPEEEVVEEEPVEEPEPASDLGPLTTPTITSVAGVTETNADGFYVVSTNPATLTGGVSGAESVVVSGYTLTKFTSGDSTWTYYANADYGLMEAGENYYDVHAVSSDGTKSETITVKVLYQPSAPAEEPQEETPAEEPTEEPQTAQDPVQ